MSHVVTISANVDTGTIGPNDEVFLLIKRKDAIGRDVAREQFPADLIEGGVKIGANYAKWLRNAPDIAVEYPED
jgi:hypothetical protein